MHASLLHLLPILVGMGLMRTWAVDLTNSNLAPTLPDQMALTQAQERARQAEAGGDLVGRVAALNDEADAALRLHEFDEAEKLRLEVLRLQEDHAGRNSLAVADALLNLGWFYSNLARYEEAQSAFDGCLDIRQRLLGADATPVAETYNALAVLEENRSNFALAEAFYGQALAIQEKGTGLQDPVKATTWNNLATLYWITGNYAQAQKYFTQALAVREKAFGPDSLVVATTLNNLALLDSSLGDYDEAESYFQRALQIRTTRLPQDHPLTITTLFELGLLDVREGDDTYAEPLLVRAAEVRQRTYGEDHPDVARSLYQLGLLYDRQKLYAKAEPLLIQAAAIRLHTLGPNHPEYASSLAALARHDHAQGRLGDALPLYQQALKIDRDSLGKNHPDTVAIANDLACLKLELGQRDDALALARDVAEAQQDLLNGVFAFAPERQRMDFEKTIEPCDLPAALGDADLLAETVLRTKGLVLDSLLEDEAMSRAARDPDVQALMEKRRLLSARLLQEQEEGSGAEDSPAAVADRQNLETQEQQLEASLAQKGIGSGKTRRALATDVSDVRGALPADAALVEYIAYNRYLGHLAYEPDYGALVLTRDGPTKWVPLGAAAEIDGRLRTYEKYMRVRVREAALSAVLHGLYTSLGRPVIAALPDGVHRLVLSPDGALNFVSFATLLDEQDRFLGDDFELNYVASGRDLLEKPLSLPDHPWVMIFAYPDYDHLAGDSDVKRRRSIAESEGFFDPLPGTRQEAALVAAEASRAHFSVEICGGAAANKPNLVALDSPYILHLATHGLYLSPDDVPHLPPAADGAQTSANQAMSRSLLALSGASVTLRDWQKGIFSAPDNDGLLTAQEVANLNLEKTWLVVLSACDSGGGEARVGEGVLGLRRGFAEAGAQNLLMTLWTVDDASTADFMAAFYREALRTGDAPGALASVQRSRLDDLRRKSGLSEAVRQAGPFILSY